MAEQGDGRGPVKGIALDLGSITGWAGDDSTSNSGTPLAGIWDCTHRGDDLGSAFLRFENHLITAVNRLRPGYIAKEAAIAPRWGRTNLAALRKLLGLSAIAELTAKRFGIPCYDVHISTARKYFVGNARAQKSDIVWKCQQLGWPDFDPNACDALCVLAYARECFGEQQILGRVL